MAIIECLRDALPGEAGALEGLQRRASFVWEEYRAALRAHPDAIRISPEDIGRGGMRVAIGAAGVLGFSAVVPGDPDRGHPGVIGELDGLFVEPDLMGRGVGRALVADAGARARDGGADWLAVTANPRAVGFYVKVGFVAAGEVATRFGPGLRMHLDLRGRGDR